MSDREKVIKGLEKCKRCECDDCTEKGASQAPWDCPAYEDFVDRGLALLKEQPEIVRCKDCKHGELCNEGDVFCTKDIGTIESCVHKPEWFCADGERK